MNTHINMLYVCYFINQQYLLHGLMSVTVIGPIVQEQNNEELAEFPYRTTFHIIKVKYLSYVDLQLLLLYVLAFLPLWIESKELIN